MIGKVNLTFLKINVKSYIYHVQKVYRQHKLKNTLSKKRMRREFFISIYLFVFKLIFNFFKKRPLEDKTVFVASFGGNVNATIGALDNLVENHQIIILADENYNA